MEKGLHFVVYKDASQTYDGLTIPASTEEFDSPFIPGGRGFSGYCWVLTQGFFGKYILVQHKVRSIDYCGGWRINLDNSIWYDKSCIGRTIFEHTDLEKAIKVAEEKVEEKKRLKKVKVKYCSN